MSVWMPCRTTPWAGPATTCQRRSESGYDNRTIIMFLNREVWVNRKTRAKAPGPLMNCSLHNWNYARSNSHIKGSIFSFRSPPDAFSSPIYRIMSNVSLQKQDSEANSITSSIRGEWKSIITCLYYMTRASAGLIPKKTCISIKYTV